MKDRRLLAGAFGVVFLTAALVLIYQALFPGDEALVRRAVVGLARSASSTVEGKDAGNPLYTAKAARKVASYFKPQANVVVAYPGGGKSVSGQQEVQQVYAWLRTRFSPIEFTFQRPPKLSVDSARAAATATARIRVFSPEVAGSTAAIHDAFNVTFNLEKVEGDWLIAGIEAHAAAEE